MMSQLPDKLSILSLPTSLKPIMRSGNLIYAERREIIHILIAFADMLRPEAEDLIHAYSFLGNVDFIRAKASLAIKINAILPSRLSEKPCIHWNEAVHPSYSLLTSVRRKR